MKKIFTLVIAAAMAVPMFGASVGVKLYVGVKGATVSGTITEISAGDYIGEYKNQQVTYIESTDTYIFTNFLGYEKFNFGLMLDTTKDQYKPGQIAITPITEYGADNDPDLAERNSIAFVAAPPTSKKTYYLSAYFNPDKTLSSARSNANTGPDRDAECYRSGVFEGQDKDWMIYQPRFNVIGTETQTCRTYAVENGNKIIFNLSATIYGEQSRDKGGEWTEYQNSNGEAPAGIRMFVIELNKGLQDLGPTGIETIGTDNADAPAVYYNLQGVEVENPAGGIYIRRQGDKVEKVVIR